MGLVLNETTINGDNCLIQTIRNCIDNNNPVFMITRYSALFYHIEYMIDSFDHGITINEYDAERALIGIRDIFQSRDTDKYDVSPISRIQLKDEMIIEIWTNSNRIYEKNNAQFLNKLYYLSQLEETLPKQFSDLFKELICTISPSQSYFAKWIKEYTPQEINYNNHSSKESVINYHFSNIRKGYYNSLMIFFDVLSKFTVNIQCNNEFDNMKSSYLQSRNMILNKIHADTLRGRVIDDSFKKTSMEKIINGDKELFLYIDNCLRLI